MHTRLDVHACVWNKTSILCLAQAGSQLQPKPGIFKPYLRQTAVTAVRGLDEIHCYDAKGMEVPLFN